MKRSREVLCSALMSKSYNPVQLTGTVHDPSSLKAIFNSQKPVIFKGLCHSWPAMNHPDKLWTFVSLKNRLSTTRVQVEAYGDYMNPKMKMVQINFGQLIDYIQSGKRDHFYLAQRQLIEFSDLEADVVVPPLCGEGKGHLYKYYYLSWHPTSFRRYSFDTHRLCIY